MHEGRTVKKTTRAGIRIAAELRDVWRAVPLSPQVRRQALDNFVGWAYVQGQDIPQTDEEIDAFVLAFHTFLKARDLGSWRDAYLTMCYARQNGERRASRWFTVTKTLARTLPAQSAY
jgi:hypothetical protein